jgi:hypothetical protein
VELELENLLILTPEAVAVEEVTSPEKKEAPKAVKKEMLSTL